MGAHHRMAGAVLAQCVQPHLLDVSLDGGQQLLLLFFLQLHGLYHQGGLGKVLLPQPAVVLWGQVAKGRLQLGVPQPRQIRIPASRGELSSSGKSLARDLRRSG